MEENSNKQPVPNGTPALVWGILSCVFGCGVLGFIFSIIGLNKAKSGMAAYNANPEAYDGVGKLKAGKICSIIGIIISAIGLIFWIVYICVVASALGSMY